MALRLAMLVMAATLSTNTAKAAEPTTQEDAAPATTKHRLIVLTDVGADPDDTQSLVCLMLYPNEIDIEGLVATTSVWRQKRVSPELIRKVVQEYGKVQPNLLKHDGRYPSASAIAATIKQGLPRYGMSGVGKGFNSEGSEWIIRQLKNSDPRPLWITAWGGLNTLAQALLKLRETETPAELKRLVAKLRVNTISDQDDAGPWLRQNFPQLFYIVDPGGDYDASTWIAINSFVEGIDNSRIGNAWLSANIQQGHGPLGAAYPDVSWGMEGDTPSWLALVPNGLNEPERPDWGGCSGRYVLSTPHTPVENPKTFLDGNPIPQESRPIWTSTTDRFFPPLQPGFGRAKRKGETAFAGNRVTLWRWRDDFQNDFAARMSWTTQSYGATNHAPVIRLDKPAEITGNSGDVFNVSAALSTDPDGDSLGFYWYTYPEAGSAFGDLVRGVENSESVELTAPKVDKRTAFHVILEVQDKGSPSLKSYKRVLVTVLPN